MKARIKFILFNPYFHSFLISIIIILFLPDVFERFSVTPLDSGSTNGVDDLVYYNDLNMDGSSEKISSFYSTDSLHAIQIFDTAGGLIDQWNIHGNIPGSDKRIYISDYDRNGIKEVFVFALNDKTIILSCFNPFKTNEFEIYERSIIILKQHEKKIDFEISDIISADFNKDKIDELIFSINNTSTLQPRQIFIYDIVNDSLWFTHSTGIAFKSIEILNFDEDGKPAIAGSNTASGNIYKNDSIPYSDYSAWIACYDNDLELLFPPVEFPGIHSEIFMETYSIEDKNYIAALYNHTGPGINEPFIGIYNVSGSIVAKAELPESRKIERSLFYWPGKEGRYYVIGENGTIYELEKNFQANKVIELGLEIHPMPTVIFDFDRDGEKEIVIYCVDNKQGIIFRENFVYPAHFDLPFSSLKSNLHSCQIIEKKDQNAELFIQSGDTWQTYSYGFNRLYYLRYPIYLAIYLSIMGLVFLIRYLQRLQMKDKLRLQSDIAQLQMKAINQQIDPHFTFNAFNSIATLLKKEKGETAYNYFMRFTDLIRISLVTSDEIFRTLEDELTVVRNYLELQKLRFGDRFNYVIHIGDEIQMKQMIPKMIIQTYAENAVKHGFKNMTTGGLLKVEITKPDGNLMLIIEDNGIGRKKAAETKSDSTGLGLTIMDQYIALLNRFNGLQIEKEIIDLYNDEREPAGTKVAIKIPVVKENN